MNLACKSSYYERARGKHFAVICSEKHAPHILLEEGKRKWIAEKVLDIDKDTNA
jgi:hypothetical protein